MRTTYYLVTGAAVVLAALVVYAQFPELNRPVPAAAAAPPTAVPRLDLPPVALPPDAPLVMPGVEPAALPPAPATDAVVPPLTPAGFSEPPVLPSTAPAIPPSLPPVPNTDVPVPPVPAMPAVPAPPAGPAIPPAPPAGVEPPAVPPVPPAPPALTPPPDLTPPPAVPVTPPSKSAEPVAPLVPSPAMAPKPVTPPALTPPPAPLPVPPPVPPAPAASAQPQPEALPGTKYMVLKDDKVIEGPVTLRGDVVVVRQGALDRAFPKGQVQFVGDSRDDVYKFMLAKVPATDPAARLKVARWCMFSGLREQALTEAREVQKLQPANADAAGLVRSLELSLQQFPPGGVAKMAPPQAPSFPVDLTNRPAAPAAVDPEPDVTPEAALQFPTKVQVFLANQCVECHAKPDAGKFQLTRVDPAAAGHMATRANLRAVAAQLRKDDPAASPLLAKTLVAHGGQKVPAVASRQAIAYQTLEAWAALAVGAPAVSVPPAPSAVITPPAAPGLPVPAPATESLPLVPPAPSPVIPPPAPALPAIPPAPVGTTVPAPALPVPTVPPAVPMIPAADPLIPAVPPVSPAPPPLPKPTVPPIPPAGGFGSAAPPKPPVTGPAGDEFDPAGFNKGPK